MPITSWGTPSDPPEPAPAPGDRAVPPVRWPHPGWATIALILAWFLALLLAALVPALIVSPTASSAPGGKVLLAFLCTVAGAGIMAVIGAVLHRMHNTPIAWSFGMVPAITVFIGGIIIAMTKLF
ncbi:MAG TPA: hypothetical protein VFX33_05425 [Actinomycetales bacterium]|nr:hypothetical protein [Actinomycetales bacterium]